MPKKFTHPKLSETLTTADKQLADDFLAEQLNYNTKKTVDGKRGHIRAFGAWLRSRDTGDGRTNLTDVTPRVFKNFIRDAINDGYSSTAVHHRYYSLKTFYDWMKNEGIEGVDQDGAITDRVTRGQREYLRGNSEKQKSAPFGFYLESDEVESMLENSPHPRVRNQLIMKLMYHCGLRRGEVARIKLEYVDFSESSITVENLKAGTNQEPYRKVWFKREVGSLLRAWIHGGGRDSAYRADTSPYLFATNQADHISETTINDNVKLAADRAGIQETIYVDKQDYERKKITAHTLRHSYAVHCVKNGMDIKTLSDLMGHSDISITQKYLRFKDEARKKKALNFGPGTD